MIVWTGALSDVLGAEVNANMYATPVGQGRTFPPHTDQTDIFVLQLAGRKRWQAWYEQQRPFLRRCSLD